MKKIGILTFHRAINYGAILQMYALYTFLKDNDCNIDIIDYLNSGIESEYAIISKNNDLKTNLKNIIKNILFYKKIVNKRRKFERFIDNNFTFSEKFYNSEDMKIIDGVYDAFITGSDQIWNSTITNGIDDGYFLDFCNKSKKISYAASFGSNEILKNNFNEIVERLSKFDAISIREEDAVKYINEKTSLITKNVVDPTILLTAKEWSKIIPTSKYNGRKYIFLYSVGDKNASKREMCLKIAKKLSKKENLEIIDYSLKNNHDTVDAYCDGPLEFLDAIRNAEYVVASSFHGAVFSIIFNKKMWIATNSNTGVRVQNLMNKFGLSNRILDEKKSDEELSKAINFDSINKKLERERKKSSDWLIKQVNK